MNKSNLCITFAGAAGSSKTPITHYLSYSLDLPVFSNDVIRAEVREDLGRFDDLVYSNRRDERLKELLAIKKSFIYDASVDRRWSQLKEWLNEQSYSCFIISMDLSKPLLEKLYTAKNYDKSRIDKYIEEHKSFLDKYNDVVGLHITDDEFSKRLELALQNVKNWAQKQ